MALNTLIKQYLKAYQNQFLFIMDNKGIDTEEKQGIYLDGFRDLKPRFTHQTWYTKLHGKIAMEYDAYFHLVGELFAF